MVLNQHKKQSAIECLANLVGIEMSYQNTDDETVHAKPEIILEVVKELLSFDITKNPDEEEVFELCNKIKKIKYQKKLEPIYATHTKDVNLTFFVPEEVIHERFRITVISEKGDEHIYEDVITNIEIVTAHTVGSEKFLECNVKLPFHLPHGYHKLFLNIKDDEAEALIIKAPSKCFHLQEKKAWGAFVPLYALHSKESQGIGDFRDLADLGQYLHSHGANVVSTLPLLSCSYEEPLYTISPYSALSRLFWNEIFIDLKQIPELQSETISYEDKENTEFINYPSVWKYKKKMLKKAFKIFIKSESNVALLRQQIEQRPLLGAYGKFRHQLETSNQKWHEWSHPIDLAELQNEDLFYTYIQWIASEQIGNATLQLGKGKKGLYADIPIGSHPDGFDCWYYKDIFTEHLNVGAPPDSIFVKGQNWGFWSIHHEKLRESGYQYLIEVIRHHCQFASFIRIDHILGFHRSYLIPRGREASEGVYIRRPWNELYGILAIESHRNQCAVIGEALGTVPPEVIPCMNEYGIYHLWVLQYEIEGQATKKLPSLSKKINLQAALCHNTHDMPPLAAFFQGQDIELKKELGFIDQAQVEKEQTERKNKLQVLWKTLEDKQFIGPSPTLSLKAFFFGTTKLMAQSRAPILILNLEDIWAEERSQNVPGTLPEQGNWQRKIKYDLEEIKRSQKCHHIFNLIQKSRHGT